MKQIPIDWQQPEGAWNAEPAIVLHIAPPETQEQAPRVYQGEDLCS